MNRTLVILCASVAMFGMVASKAALSMDAEVKMDARSQASFDTVTAFMGAMGSGDMDAMSALMADDMEWHNEGDSAMPWIVLEGLFRECADNTVGE